MNVKPTVDNFMRKAYKNKKRACGLCKPHKRNWVKRSENNVTLLRHNDKMKEAREYAD